MASGRRGTVAWLLGALVVVGGTATGGLIPAGPAAARSLRATAANEPVHEHDHGSAACAPTHAHRVAHLGAVFVRPISCDTFTVSRYRPGTRVTASERRAARRLERRTLVTLRRLRRVSTAEALGYQRVDTHHWIDRAYLTDGHVLDPSRPEALVFDVDPALPEPLVLGAMYLAPPGRQGPQPGGPATVWHYHVFAEPVCSWSGAIPTGAPDRAGGCAEGAPTSRSAEMLHVWIDNPHGAFDSRMSVPAGTVVDRIRSRLAA